MASPSLQHSFVYFFSEDSHGYYLCLLALCVVVMKMFRSKPTENAKEPESNSVAYPSFHDFLKLRGLYIFCNFWSWFAYWLQLVSVYALYVSYGFSTEQLLTLVFVETICSTIAGGAVEAMMDRIGRKKSGLIYCGLMAMACYTKFFPDYQSQLWGRAFSGLALPLLTSSSVVDAWLVAEVQKLNANKFAAQWIRTTLAHGNARGCYSAPITAGVVAQLSMAYADELAPYRLSLLSLLLLAAAMGMRWQEGRPVEGQRRGIFEGISVAIRFIRNNATARWLGVVQASFEAPLQALLCLWTPALAATIGQQQQVPHAVVFASLMACVTIGNYMFSLVVMRAPVDAVRMSMRLRPVYATAGLALWGAAAAVAAAAASPVEGVTAGSGWARLLLCCCGVFQTCVGAHFAATGYNMFKHTLEVKTAAGAVGRVYKAAANCVLLLLLLIVGSQPQSGVGAEGGSLEWVLRACGCLALLAAVAQHLMVKAQLSNGQLPLPVAAAGGCCKKKACKTSA